MSEKITSGKKVYESFHGLTAHGNNPVFIVHKGLEEPFRENQGEVWFGSLEYSGNFKTIVEAVDAGFLNIVIGINDTDFAWTLKGGESFEAPCGICGVYGRRPGGHEPQDAPFLPPSSDALQAGG